MRPSPIVKKNRGFISPCRRRNPSLDLSTWRSWHCYVSWLGPDCEARVGLGLNSDLVLFNKFHLVPYPGRRQIQTDQHLQCWSTRTFSTRQTQPQEETDSNWPTFTQHWANGTLETWKPWKPWKTWNLWNSEQLNLWTTEKRSHIRSHILDHIGPYSNINDHIRSDTRSYTKTKTETNCFKTNRKKRKKLKKRKKKQKTLFFCKK